MVGDIPGPRGQGHVEAGDTAALVEADGPFRQEVVTLAGDDHVVVAVEAELDRTAGLVRTQRGYRRDDGSLAFLAAEAAAHAPHFDRDVAGSEAQDARHPVLHLGRVLGRAVDQHVAVFPGHREGNLPFEIEMVLAADFEFPGQAVRRLGNGPGGVAALHDLRLGDVALGSKRVSDRQYRRLFGDVEGDQCGGVARGGKAVGDDASDGVADIFDGPFGKQRLAANDRRNVVGAGDVVGRDDGHDAGRSSRRLDIDIADFAASNRALDQEGVERADDVGHVVDIGRGAGDVLDRAVVAHQSADATGDRIAGLLNRRFTHRA